MLKRYEHCAPALDKALLAADEYAFSVLLRIMSGECALTVTDEKSVIVCHSAPPYPVWVWTRDGHRAAEETAYKIMKESFDLGEHCFNMKHGLAERVIEMATEDGILLEVTMNMLTYQCTSLTAPERKVEGVTVTATRAQLDKAVCLLAAFNRELGLGEGPSEELKKKALGLIDEGRLFFLEVDGEAVACCSYLATVDTCSIGSVYTLPEARRRGYAARLVYDVTKKLIDSGKAPLLYTDADYPASNACYTSIGYCLKGSLCTVAIKK